MHQAHRSESKGVSKRWRRATYVSHRWHMVRSRNLVQTTHRKKSGLGESKLRVQRHRLQRLCSIDRSPLLDSKQFELVLPFFIFISFQSLIAFLFLICYFMIKKCFEINFLLNQTLVINFLIFEWIRKIQVKKNITRKWQKRHVYSIY